MLNEDEIRALIEMEKERQGCLVDQRSRICSMAFVAGLECVLND